MLAKLHEAYLGGEGFEGTNQKKDLISSWVELTKLDDCSEENLHKLYQAQEKSYDLQNIVRFINWKRDALKKKCDEDKMLFPQTTSTISPSTNESTENESFALKMSQPEGENEIQKLVQKYTNLLWSIKAHLIAYHQIS